MNFELIHENSVTFHTIILFCSLLKAVFYGLVALLHCHFLRWFTDKRSKLGEAVWSGWPSARPPRDETEKIEKDTATGWTEGLW